MSSWGSISVEADSRCPPARHSVNAATNSGLYAASKTTAVIHGGGAMSLASAATGISSTRALSQRSGANNTTYASSSTGVSRAQGLCGTANNLQQQLNELSFVVCNSAMTTARGGSHRRATSDAGAMRTLSWVQTFKLPLNANAFHTLTLRRVAGSVVDTMLREVADVVVTPRDKRSVQRLWSAMCLHEPLLMQLPFLPYLCTAVARCIPNNPVAAFEAALHFLLNTCADWMQTYPAPPTKFLHRVDRHLQAIHPQLWEHLNHGGVFNGGPEDSLWLPLQTFFLYNFPAEPQGPSSWTDIFCEVVCRSDGMQYFYAIAVSLLTVVYGEQLLACSSVEEVHAAVTTPVTDRRLMDKVRRVASAMALQLCLPAEPIADIPKADDYYPMLHVGRRPPVPVIVDKQLKLSIIEAEEVELQRRLHVELTTLVAAGDVARFHRGVANSIMCDGDERVATAASYKSFVDTGLGAAAGAQAGTRQHLRPQPAGLVPSPMSSQRFPPASPATVSMTPPQTGSPLNQPPQQHFMSSSPPTAAAAGTMSRPLGDNTSSLAFRVALEDALPEMKARSVTSSAGGENRVLTASPPSYEGRLRSLRIDHQQQQQEGAGPPVATAGDNDVASVASRLICSTAVPPAVLTAGALLRVAERRSLAAAAAGSAAFPGRSLDAAVTNASPTVTAAPSSSSLLAAIESSGYQQQQQNQGQLYFRPTPAASSSAMAGSRSASIGPTNSAPVPSTRSNSHGTPLTFPL